MYRYRHEHAVSRMAKVLEVSQSGYYKWLRRQNELSLRDIENIEIAQEILDIFCEYKGIFGIRKITSILSARRKKRVNHKRVERLMREHGIHSRVKKKHIVTTDSSTTLKPAENLLQRDFTAQRPGEKLVSDTTYVMTQEGVLYVAVIMDLYGKLPLGLAMSRKNDRQLVMDCFVDMTLRHQLQPGCILHSDRGSTYASADYQDLLRAHRVICSMSRKGDCWDNAPMESFFGKLKVEWLTRKAKTIEEAKALIYEYVWSFYPKKRPHASNQYLTPHQVYYAKV